MPRPFPPSDPSSRNLCFDLDGTLCTNTFGEYESAEPLPAAIERVNDLAAAGHRIIILTARGTATGIDWSEVTRDQLDRWGVVYEELHFGKPSADVYVDDRAVHTDAWLRGDASAPPGLPYGFPGEVPVTVPPPATVVVEVGRTFGGVPLRLDAHVDRVRRLAVAAGIAGVPSAAEIQAGVLEAVGRRQRREPAGGGSSDDAVYAVSVAGALEPVHLGTGQGPSAPRLQVACFPLRQSARALSALTVGDEDPGPPAVFARKPGAASGAPDPGAWRLEVDAEGDIHDGLGGRLGVVAGGRLALSPSTTVPTVACSWLTELAAEIGLAVEGRPIRFADLRAAEEVIVAGEPWGIVAVVAIDASRVGEGVPGPVTQRLAEAWSEAAGVDLAAQARALARHPDPGVPGSPA